MIGRDVDEESLARSWFYLPEMLHKDSLILIESRVADTILLVEWDFDAVLARSEALLGNARRAAA